MVYASGMTPAALFLDLDGTLVDSEPLHFRSHREFLSSQGITAHDDSFSANIGKGDRQFYEDLIAAHSVKGDAVEWVQQKTALLMQIYRQEGLPGRPGVNELLERALQLGIACVVVTSSTRALCSLSLEVVGLAKRLPCRICHEDTMGHKPDPAPYLLAARRLSVPSERCVVIEDSISGVISGKSAGCSVIGFPGLVSSQDLLDAGAQRCVQSLSEVLEGSTSTRAQVHTARR
jgi:HAD superfamily hydrolase (TIGR01509 family)